MCENTLRDRGLHRARGHLEPKSKARASIHQRDYVLCYLSRDNSCILDTAAVLNDKVFPSLRYFESERFKGRQNLEIKPERTVLRQSLEEVAWEGQVGRTPSPRQEHRRPGKDRETEQGRGSVGRGTVSTSRFCTAVCFDSRFNLLLGCLRETVLKMENNLLET